MANGKNNENIWWEVLLSAIGFLVVKESIKVLAQKDPLKAMKEIVNNMKSHFQIRQITSSLIGKCEPNDRICQIQSIYRFVADRIRYMADPFRKEHLANPLETLQIQAGDCDCKSILLATLLESCGLETQFVEVPGHVFVRVTVEQSDILKIPKGGFYIPDKGKFWIPLESTAKGAPIGWMSKSVYENLIRKQARVL